MKCNFYNGLPFLCTKVYWWNISEKNLNVQVSGICVEVLNLRLVRKRDCVTVSDSRKLYSGKFHQKLVSVSSE